jgi:hypothetical protein
VSGVAVAAVIVPRGRQCGGETGWGDNTTSIAGEEVVLSSLSREGEGDAGGGMSLVVVVVRPRWR